MSLASDTTEQASSLFDKVSLVPHWQEPSLVDARQCMSIFPYWHFPILIHSDKWPLWLLSYIRYLASVFI